MSWHIHPNHEMLSQVALQAHIRCRQLRWLSGGADNPYTRRRKTGLIEYQAQSTIDDHSSFHDSRSHAQAAGSSDQKPIHSATKRQNRNDSGESEGETS